MNNRFQKGIETGFLILFFATPLIMFHKTSELFEFNKLLFVYLVTAFILALWVGKMILAKKILIVKTPLDIAIIVFIVSQILSTIFSIDQHTSFYGYYGRFNGGLLSISTYITLYYAYVSNCVYETQKKTFDFVIKMLQMLLISSGIVILWGLPGKFGYDTTCYLFTGKLNNNCWTDQFHPAERLFSTLGQPNWLASFLCITFFIGLYFLMTNWHNKKNRFLYQIYLFLNVSCLLFTRSRSALFALFVGLFFLNALFIKKSIIKKRDVTLLLTLIVILPIVLFKTGIPKIDSYLPTLTMSPHKSDTIITTQSAREQTATINVTDSLDIRKIVWKGAIQLGLTHPWFGTGVETFAYAYNFVKPIEHNLTSEWDFIYNKAHNEYANYFATTGFFGLTAYLFFVGQIMYVCFFTTRKKDDYQLAPFIGTALLSILITNFFGFSTVTINLILYLFPALIVALYHGRYDASKTIYAERTKHALVVSFFILMCGVIFVSRYLVADISYATGDTYLKSEEYTTAEKYLRTALFFKYEHVYQDKLSTILANEVFFNAYTKINDNDMKNPEKKAEFEKKITGLFAEADEYNRKSLVAAPKNVTYWKTRAKNYYILYQLTNRDEDFNKSMQALDMAAHLAPTDPKIPYSKVLFYLSQFDNKKINDTKEIENKLIPLIDRSIYLKPNYRDAYFAKGLVLKRVGNPDAAKKIFEYILKNIDPKDTEVKNELTK